MFSTPTTRYRTRSTVSAPSPPDDLELDSTDWFPRSVFLVVLSLSVFSLPISRLMGFHLPLPVWSSLVFFLSLTFVVQLFFSEPFFFRFHSIPFFLAFLGISIGVLLTSIFILIRLFSPFISSPSIPLTNFNSEFSKIRSSLSTYSSAIVSLQSDLQRQQSSQSSLHKELLSYQSSFASRLDSLNSELKSLRKVVDILVEGSKSTLVLKGDLKETMKTVKQVQDEIEHQQSDLSSITKLVNQLVDGSTSNDVLIGELDNTKKTVEHITDDMNSFSQKLQYQQSELSSLTKLVKQLSDGLQSNGVPKNTDVEDTQKSIQQIQGQILNITQKLQFKHSEVAHLTKLVEKVILESQTNLLLQKEIEETKSLIAKAREEIDELTRELKEQKDMNFQTDGESVSNSALKGVQNDVSAINNKIAELEAKFSDFKFSDVPTPHDEDNFFKKFPNIAVHSPFFSLDLNGHSPLFKSDSGLLRKALGKSSFEDLNLLDKILTQDLSPGQCTPLKGSSVFMSFDFSENLNIHYIGIDHASREYFLDFKTAPKHFKVLCEDTVLVESVYEIRGPTLQTFPVPKPRTCKKLTLVVSDNNGAEYTCLYRLRVHVSREEVPESYLGGRS
ncbi:hypothetical protein GEMRC1_011886 [Eukaryota sp. GEM-RC1]